jgi:hypothetical protein|tara:strand:+ start:703 stop:1269 length:567 start_codon:yes stop_codon:yes gene_type:complete
MSTEIDPKDLFTAPSETITTPGAVNTQAENVNYLYPTNYRFLLTRTPAVTYNCTKASLPSLELPAVIQGTTLVNEGKVSGGKITYGDLTVSFLVDENLENWREIYDWMLSLGTSYDPRFPEADEKKKYSNATLTVLNSAMNPKFEVQFNNIFPVSLGGIDFDSSVSGMDAFAVDVSFAYDYYDIRSIG